MLFKIHSKASCTYCTQAKQLLESLSLPFQVLSLENGDWTKASLEDTLQMSIKSVPQITYGNVYVGGFKELQDFLVEHDMLNG